MVSERPGLGAGLGVHPANRRVTEGDRTCVAALIQFLLFPGTGLVFGVAVALLGFLSLSGAGNSAVEPSRVR
jgi:hypothetical protein